LLKEKVDGLENERELYILRLEKAQAQVEKTRGALAQQQR
jgi:hypothetical protein